MTADAPLNKTLFQEKKTFFLPMLFNSLEYFFLFLPLAALIYFVCTKFSTKRMGTIWLIAASLIFYGYSAPKHLPLICLSILTNFFVGGLLIREGDRGAEQSGSRKKSFILASGIIANILFLGYCKYAHFFIETINQTARTSFPLPELTLPLAVSFYTFQQISYLVDCSNSKISESNIIDYFFFVLFFPQLIAGPILRYTEIIPQMRQKYRMYPDWDNIAQGIFIFSAGLFKKVVIADSFATWSVLNSGPGQAIGFIDAWTTSLSYSFQLYYDFSGYSDMAIGAALLFNIRIPVNFNSPYQASDIQDFWRRWHMTLSRWLRDYLYIPLGGGRKGTSRTLTNIFITFLLGGIWHGAGWTFVVWGALHGSALALHRAWRMTGRTMNASCGRLCTFLFINFAWVYFQSPSIPQANRMIKAMFGIETAQPITEEFARYFETWKLLPLTDLKLPSLIIMIIFALSVFITPNTMQSIRFIPYEGIWSFKTDHNFALLTSLLFMLSLMTFMGATGQTEFIYFQF
jgi:D-alanyl-lipoteichoic acid acyltransferase DltB (MBOAT superfamily)